MRLICRSTASRTPAVGIALVAALASAAILRAGDVLFAVDVTDPSAQVVRRIDPYTRDSEVVWRGGGDLDIAVSEDLTRLYVNHLNGAGRGHKLTAVDLATGTRLATVDTPYRLRWTVPTAPTTKLSPDGRKLYLLNLHSSPEEERYGVVVFDTDFSRFLGEEVSLGECSAAQLWPLEEDGELLILCRGTGMIHSVKFSSDGAIEQHEQVQVPPAPVKPLAGPRVSRSDGEESIVQVALDQDEGALLLAERKGEFFRLDTRDLSLTKLQVKPLRKGTKIAHNGTAFTGTGRWHLKFEAPVSYDVTFLVQGVLDLNSLSVKIPDSVAKPVPDGSVARGGDYVYITNPNDAGIHVLDAATAEPVAIIQTVLKPAFVIRRTRG